MAWIQFLSLAALFSTALFSTATAWSPTSGLYLSHMRSRVGLAAAKGKPSKDTKRLILVRHGEVDLAMFSGK